MDALTKLLATPVEVTIAGKTLVFHLLTIGNFHTAAEHLRQVRSEAFQRSIQTIKLNDEMSIGVALNRLKDDVTTSDVLTWSNTPDGMAYLLSMAGKYATKQHSMSPEWIANNLTVIEGRDILNQLLTRSLPDAKQEAASDDSKNGEGATTDPA